MTGCFNRINICAKKEKFPSIFFFLSFDHLLYFINAINVACIFHSISHDDKNGMLRYIFRARIFVDISNVMDSTADRIQESRTAVHRIIVFCHRGNLLHLYSVIKDFTVIVKKHGRNQRLPCLSFLLFNHRIEAAYGIHFQSAHGSAAI